MLLKLRLLLIAAALGLAGLACSTGGTAPLPTLVPTLAPAATQPAVAPQATQQPASAAMPTLPPTFTAPPPTVVPTTAPPVAAPPSVPADTTPYTVKAYTPGETVQVGEAVRFNDLILLVLGWREAPGTDRSQPSEGMRFVIVDAVVVNAGAKTVSLDSDFDLTLIDPAGDPHSYSFDAGLAVGIVRPGGDLSPGQRVRGLSSFEVPQGQASGFKFVLAPSIESDPRLVVDLGEAAPAITPPALIEGETPQASGETGKAQEAGNIIFTVNSIKALAPRGENQPWPGYRFVIVDMTFTNRGFAKESIPVLFALCVEDDTGQRFYLGKAASGAAQVSAAPPAELASGETAQSQMAFEVPEASAYLRLLYDTALFSEGGVLSVALPMPAP